MFLILQNCCINVRKYYVQGSGLNWPQQSTGGACQSSEMAAVLNSLSFVFKNLFLPKSVRVFLCFCVNETMFKCLEPASVKRLVTYKFNIRPTAHVNIYITLNYHESTLTCNTSQNQMTPTLTKDRSSFCDFERHHSTLEMPAM